MDLINLVDDTDKCKAVVSMLLIVSECIKVRVFMEHLTVNEAAPWNQL